VPFEGDQQIHPPGIGHRPNVEQQQRRRVLAAGHAGGQFGGDRVRRDEHVNLRDGRHLLEHVCESINCRMCRPTLFHKEIPAIRKPAP
jgi:hypothetical protein